VIRASVLGGALLVMLGCGANVLLAVLYNLISDVVGGIIVVFEERPTLRRSGKPRPAMRLEEPAKPLRPARQRVDRSLHRTPPGSPPGPDPLPQVQPEQVEPAELTRPSD
jgi:hypothetical protein